MISILQVEVSHSHSNPDPAAKGSNASGKKRRFPSGVIGLLPVAVLCASMSTPAFALGSRAWGDSDSGSSLDSSPRFQEGQEVGAASARRVTVAVAQKTIGRSGCSALNDFENALARVLRTLRAPRATEGSTQSEEAFVQGYFSGYSAQIREALREKRAECDALRYQSGIFPGVLQGSYLCAAWEYSPAWVTSGVFPAAGLYAGWSDGSVEIESECRVSVERELIDCAGDLSEGLRSQRAFEVCQAN